MGAANTVGNQGSERLCGFEGFGLVPLAVGGDHWTSFWGLARLGLGWFRLSACVWGLIVWLRRVRSVFINCFVNSFINAPNMRVPVSTKLISTVCS